MKMKLVYFISMCFLSCSNNNGPSVTPTSAAIKDTQIYASSSSKQESFKASPSKDTLIKILDTLTKGESSFLKEISTENEFILLSNEVARYYSSSNLKKPVINELLYTENFLQDNGYVVMKLSFLSSIDYVRINYNYSLGQASVGYGSVAGNGVADYVHSFNSCGVSNCILTIFKNKNKVLEKEFPSN